MEDDFLEQRSLKYFLVGRYSHAPLSDKPILLCGESRRTRQRMCAVGIYSNPLGD